MALHWVFTVVFIRYGFFEAGGVLNGSLQQLPFPFALLGHLQYWRLKGNTAQCNAIPVSISKVWEQILRPTAVVGPFCSRWFETNKLLFWGLGLSPCNVLWPRHDLPAAPLQRRWTFYLVPPHNSLGVCLCLCGISLLTRKMIMTQPKGKHIQIELQYHWLIPEHLRQTKPRKLEVTN